MNEQALHPSQFQVNEAWIVFKLNDAPICTEEEGDFNVIAIMDAASCFIMGMEFLSVESQELLQLDSKKLLKTGWSHKQQFPKSLFIPNTQQANNLVSVAEREGIEITSVSEAELLVFIGEARDGFREQFGGATQ